MCPPCCRACKAAGKNVEGSTARAGAERSERGKCGNHVPGIPKGAALGVSLPTFSTRESRPGCGAERPHRWVQGLPVPHNLPGAWGGAPKRWEQEPAASCNFRVQGGVPAKGHAGTFVPAKDLAPDQNRLGDIRRGFGVPGVKICPDLFGVLLGQHRAAHHHLAGEVLSSQRGDGLLHAL